LDIASSRLGGLTARPRATHRATRRRRRGPVPLQAEATSAAPARCWSSTAAPCRGSSATRSWRCSASRRWLNEELAREAVALAERTDALETHGEALVDLAEVLSHGGRSDQAAAALGDPP
jgi:hypothetical protein